MSALNRFNSFRQLSRAHPFIHLIELGGAVLLLLSGITGHLPFSSTPYVLIYGWIWLRLRGSGWGGVGLSGPENWKKVFGLSFLIGIGYQVLSIYVVEPLLGKMTGNLPDVSVFKPLVGNIQYFLLSLLASWILAAFGEELLYRGYLIDVFALVTGKRTISWISAAILSSIFFGLAHLYQDFSGVLTAGIHGLVFAGLYFYTGRNLWAPILAHGIHDSFGFMMIYLGIYPGLN